MASADVPLRRIRCTRPNKAPHATDLPTERAIRYFTVMPRRSRSSQTVGAQPARRARRQGAPISAGHPDNPKRGPVRSTMRPGQSAWARGGAGEAIECVDGLSAAPTASSAVCADADPTPGSNCINRKPAALWRMFWAKRSAASMSLPHALSRKLSPPNFTKKGYCGGSVPPRAHRYGGWPKTGPRGVSAACQFPDFPAPHQRRIWLDRLRRAPRSFIRVPIGPEVLGVSFLGETDHAIGSVKDWLG